MNNYTKEKINYIELINIALENKGKLSECFSIFHDYSVLNTMYILRQLIRKNLPIEPIKGYKAWNKLNRKVKNELLNGKTKYGFPNGIEVLFPIFGYYPKKDENGNILKDKNNKTIFVKYLKDFSYNKWHFSFAQTEIMDKTKPVETLTENKFNINIEQLCKDLDIKIIPYDDLNGNVQGYALTGRKELAINPVAQKPVEVSLHEIAHILHEHKATQQTWIKEVEAEMVAYLVLSICNNEFNPDESIGYIHNWLKDNELTQEMGQHIFNVTNKILETLKK